MAAIPQKSQLCPSSMRRDALPLCIAPARDGGSLNSPQRRKRQKPCGLWRFPGAHNLFGPNTIRQSSTMNLQQNRPSYSRLAAPDPSGLRPVSACGKPPAFQPSPYLPSHLPGRWRISLSPSPTFRRQPRPPVSSVRLRVLPPSPSGLPSGFPAFEDAHLAAHTLSARSPRLLPDRTRPFRFPPSIITPACAAAESPVSASGCASCPIRSLPLTSPGGSSGGRTRLSNQPSMSNQSRFEPATIVCVLSNFASSCSAEDGYPILSRISFPRLAPPAITRVQSNLSSSCRAGNVRFQFVSGLPTDGTMRLPHL